MPGLHLGIMTRFDGYGENVPFEFEEYYLGVSLPEIEAAAYKVEVELYVSPRLRMLVSPRGWRYYHWLDSFVESFDEAFSKDTYIRSIGWDTASTVIEILKRK
jgi:hypothetical protein